MSTRSRFILSLLLVAEILAARPVHARAGTNPLANLTAITNGAGEPLRVDDLEGSVVVVDVWASWCAPCVNSLPDLQAIARETRGRGVRIVPISIDRGGAVAAVRAYARKNIRDLPLYVGPPRDVMKHFGVTGLPFTLVYDSRGRIVARFQGAQAAKPAALRRAIKRALAAK